jgi:hypothetical protein
LASEVDDLDAFQAVARGLGIQLNNIQLNKKSRVKNMSRDLSRIYHRWECEQRAAFQQASILISLKYNEF